MDVRTGFEKSAGRGFGLVAVNSPIAAVAVEATRLGINAPNAELGAIEGELQPLIAVLQCRLVLPSLGEQRGKHERTGREGQQRGPGRVGAIVQAWQLSQVTHGKSGGPDHRKSQDKHGASREYWTAVSGQ